MRVRYVIFCLFGFVNFETHSQSETVRCEAFVYDYFKEKKEVAIYEQSNQILMPFDSIEEDGKNEYCVKKVLDDLGNGSITVFYRNNLLFKYQVVSNEIKGAGICYYPFQKNDIAVIGWFKKSKLHGHVYVFDNKGVLVEVIKYKNGKYKKHLFYISRVGREFKYKGSKNPLRLDYEIILY